MKAAPLLVAWHNDSAPIYSVQFEHGGKGRLASAGGDNNVRLWKLNGSGGDQEVTYLSTLTRHTQAVNVVRWSPRGEMLASAGDDGNVLLWVPSDHGPSHLGEEHADDKETWVVKRMCRSTSGAEIYDLAWSPDGAFFVTGSMDNVARIFSAETGTIVRQIAEHNHYVQGVAWDPLNEYLATQSSDRSVHVYSLKTTDGQFSLSQHGRISRMDLPPRRRPSNSPAPSEFGHSRARSASNTSNRVSSPAPSAPGTPHSLALPMNPPATISRSRRSSIGNASPSLRRSASPAPAMPLPAVMPASSPVPYANIGMKNTNIYANETLTSFFRRLAFAPDGSLLFTPAGQYKTAKPATDDSKATADDVTNTVYIYSRAGLNKPPIAHLPGHKKPSIAVRCSPIVYNHRLPMPTQNITFDSSSKEDDIAPLPEPAHVAKNPPTSAPTLDTTKVIHTTSTTPSASNPTSPDSATPSAGPKPAFSLPYRIIYAVATQDTVYIYDTQQTTPLCIISNLHYATFTDLTWSNDGETLLISSSDGFASAITFAPGELGTKYHGSLQTRISHPSSLNTVAPNSLAASPMPTPTGAAKSPGLPPPGPPKLPSIASFATSPSPAAGRPPASPTRSNSASSIATQSSFPQTPASYPGLANPVPTYGKLPSVAAVGSSLPTMTSPTPPMTPLNASESQTTVASGSDGFAVPAAKVDGGDSVLGKRGSVSETEKEGEAKKRRIAPTLLSAGSKDPPAPSTGGAAAGGEGTTK
ncbi:MAG: hypothetical protein Q9162_000163 [Coniocarpon cinnabarinum]